jgi:ribosomal protein L37AE/L43A
MARVEAGVWVRWGGGWSLEPDPKVFAHSKRPRLGRPWWCSGCGARILDDLARFTDLAAALYTTGHEEPPPTLRLVVSREQLRSHVARDVLDCGHLFTYVWHPPLALPPTIRRCGLCLVSHTGYGEGKIKSAEAQRRPTRTGSPSGSPAWDAIDELVMWAANAEDRLRGYLRQTRPKRDARVGSSESRARTLSQSLRYLLEWGPQLLALPEGLEVGRQIQRLVVRAERASSLDRLVHRLPKPCPSCDLKTLERVDGSETVSCRNRACGRSWTEEEYQWMVRTQVNAQRA